MFQIQKISFNLKAGATMTTKTVALDILIGNAKKQAYCVVGDVLVATLAVIRVLHAVHHDLACLEPQIILLASSESGALFKHA